MDGATVPVVTGGAGKDRVEQQPVDPVGVAEGERLITVEGERSMPVKRDPLEQRIVSCAAVPS